MNSMSPQRLPLSPTHTQVDFQSWSKLKLTLKVKNFIKEYVSLILLLSTIFKNSQLCILLCSSHRDPNTFLPKWIP
jgi:hypothetical protein